MLAYRRMTIADVGELSQLSQGHARTSKDISQKGSVDGVMCIGKVDKAQVQGGVVLLPRQFLISSYYEHHVNRRELGSQPTLFLPQNVLAMPLKSGLPA